MKNHLFEIQKGFATSAGHFGELLQGEFASDGEFVRALVTMPFDSGGATAAFEYDPLTDVVDVQPVEFEKARRAAVESLRHLQIVGGGRLVVTSTLPSGGGCGSSSACVHATIDAVANATGKSIEEDIASEIALAAEGAVDPVHLVPRTMLFAQLRGSVIEEFPGRLPNITGIGVFDGEPVDTLTFERPVYSPADLATFSVLRSAMRRAMVHRDPFLIGRVATASARINQKYLPKPNFQAVLEIVNTFEAAGVCVSHSGSALAVLLAGSRNQNTGLVDRVDRALRELGFNHTVYFQS